MIKLFSLLGIIMNNINPKLWGPSAWSFLHYITLAYPNNPTDIDKINIQNVFNNIGNVLPCEACRFNYSKNLLKHPLNDMALNSKNNLINWLINIHNEVNIENGKNILTYDEVIKLYFNKTNYKKIYIVLFGILLIFILIFCMKYYF